MMMKVKMFLDLEVDNQEILNLKQELALLQMLCFKCFNIDVTEKIDIMTIKKLVTEIEKATKDFSDTLEELEDYINEETLNREV